MPESQRQQYEQMRQSLSSFRSGTINLGSLVEQLPELLKETEDPDASFKDQYVSYWWTLEQIHEQAIELGESRRMPSTSRQTVDDAVGGLEILLDEALTAN